MGIIRALQTVPICSHCGGPMPPPAGRGRPAVYCSGRCRKAAHEARRTAAPDAFEVKVVERVVVENHDLSECTSRVVASPVACSRVLQALARAAADGTLGTDPKWRRTQAAALGLADTMTAPRGRFAPPRR